jgi:GH25 family lysozyme M1 (1,4-beta-N-acetylmuramidase)
MINGIDVSSYQSATYSVRDLDFVFVKATEGTTYVNPKQKAEAARARKAGLAVGFYHFLHPGHIYAQASYFVEQCDSVHGDMLVVDWETCPDGNHASNEEKDQFLAAVRELRPDHHRIGLYCNTDYWLHVDKTSVCGDFLWIAAPGVTHPPIRHPWMFWQTGERGGVDQDVCALHSRAALRNWCGYGD